MVALRYGMRLCGMPPCESWVLTGIRLRSLIRIVVEDASCAQPSKVEQEPIHGAAKT